MQVGDIFTINDTAIAALEKAGHSIEWAVGQKDNKKMFRLTSGMQFRIANKGLKLMPTELRASRLDSTTGKAIRGRPRKFPGQIVADLMGETLAAFSAAPVAVSQPSPVAAAVATAPLVANSVVNGQTTTDHAPLGQVDEAEQAEQVEEQKRVSQEKVEALFGAIGDDSTDDDWK